MPNRHCNRDRCLCGHERHLHRGFVNLGACSACECGRFHLGPFQRLNSVSLREAALQYATRGWRVFPIMPRTKDKPWTGWPTIASNDPSVVGAWWRRFPHNNVGVTTGMKSGIAVGDVDDFSFDVQWDTLADRTCRGLQYFFTIDTPLESTTRLKYIHIRGDGGYVVLPPSVHPEGPRYQWLSDKPLLPFPEEIRRQLEASRMVGAAHTTPQQKGEGRPTSGAWDHTVYRGNRDDKLFRTALAMAYRGLGHDAIVRELLRIFNRFYENPEDPIDIERKARQALKYAAKARGA